MAVNRGKQFEDIIKSGFEKIRNTSVTRLYDTMSGFEGHANICDFIVYKYPHQYYIECKSCHGNTLSIYSNDSKHCYGNISNKQWEGLLKVSPVEGVIAGYIIWFIDKDITIFISAEKLLEIRNAGNKSLNVKNITDDIYQLVGTKKRVFFDYDMDDFFRSVKE